MGWIHHPKPRTPEWLSKKLVPIICFVRDQFSNLLSLPYHTYHNYTYAEEVAQTSLHYWLKRKIKHNKIFVCINMCLQLLKRKCRLEKGQELCMRFHYLAMRKLPGKKQ